jgi:thioredoxin-dependent peroxiredoxin
MTYYRPFRIVLAVLVCALPVVVLAASPPRIGEKAPDFALKTLDERTTRLSDLISTNPVVLVVLRGWPGYQCPLCTAQVQDYISSASVFTKSKVRVLMVYPGPAPELKAHGEEFLKDKQWPKDFVYLLDPDFTMINAYGLRWDAPGETSYPSTFVIDQKGIVRFAKISQSHGNRTKAQDILEEVKRIPAD